MSEQVPDSTHIHRLLGTPTMFLRTGASSPFCALPSPVLPRLAPSGVALLKVSFQAPAPPFLHHQDYLGVPAPPGLMPPLRTAAALPVLPSEAGNQTELHSASPSAPSWAETQPAQACSQGRNGVPRSPHQWPNKVSCQPCQPGVAAPHARHGEGSLKQKAAGPEGMKSRGDKGTNHQPPAGALEDPWRQPNSHTPVKHAVLKDKNK